MGLCASGLTPEEEHEKRKAAELDKKLQKDHLADNLVHKLLLLGAGESGKSTLFKQMITIYGKGFDSQERATFVPVIHNNIIASVKALCAVAPQLQEHHRSDKFALHPEVEPIRAYFASDEFKEGKVDSEIAMRMDVLWKSEGIQNTYAHRHEFQLNDSTKYYLDDIMRIGHADYLPTGQDVLRSRVRTTGIVEQPFVIDNNQFKMFDVGGQRNERKKWVHCFEGVTAVLFVAAIHEYDMALFEDETTNRMVEAVALFDEIANSRWFRETSLVLFLNKKDLLQEKISDAQPLCRCPLFAEYKGPNTFEAAVDQIKHEFVSKVGGVHQQCYVHVTCATDTDNCKVVFNAVKDIVIRKSLREGGIL